MEDKKSKKGSKILTGIIIGSAIGSVIGMSVAPKSGKETRKTIGEQSKKTWNILKTLFKGKKN